uniref:C-type lectin domain-containing protein n=1 Tax=Anopheles atroparvus TaxID=41427 RepID=A0AAG5D6G5_ANOAO
MATQCLASMFAIVLYCLQINSINTTSVDGVSFAINRGKSYHFENALKLNWFKAAEYCRTQDMFLVSINDEQELNDAIDYVQSSGYFGKNSDLQLWTSGNDLGESGQFYWSTTGARITFDRFADNEPSNTKYQDGSTEDCVVLERSKGRNLTFDDRPCRREYHFLCENQVC